MQLGIKRSFICSQFDFVKSRSRAGPIFRVSISNIYSFLLNIRASCIHLAFYLFTDFSMNDKMDDRVSGWTEFSFVISVSQFLLFIYQLKSVKLRY